MCATNSRIRRQSARSTATADVDEAAGNARQVVASLQSEFMPRLQLEFPQIEVLWEGQQEQNLIPMATSIAFGEMFATLLVVFLVPVAYSLYWSLLRRHTDRPISELSHGDNNTQG